MNSRQVNRGEKCCPSMRRARGFSMAGAVVGALVVGTVSVGGAMLYGDHKRSQVAQARAMQLGSGLTQLESYALKYHAQLAAGQSIAGVTNAAAPNTEDLRKLGFAAAEFDDASQPGGAMLFRIARTPAGCAADKCILALTVVTSGSVQRSGGADAVFAQEIAGYIPNGAGWSSLVDNAAVLGKNGKTIPNPLGNTPAVVAAATWIGNNQPSQVVPPPTYNYQSLSCGAGYTGSIEQSQKVTTDKWGAVTYSGWSTDTENCALIPPPAPATPPGGGGSGSPGSGGNGGGGSPGTGGSGGSGGGGAPGAGGSGSPGGGNGGSMNGGSGPGGNGGSGGDPGGEPGTAPKPDLPPPPPPPVEVCYRVDEPGPDTDCSSGKESEPRFWEIHTICNGVLKSVETTMNLYAMRTCWGTGGGSIRY